MKPPCQATRAIDRDLTDKRHPGSWRGFRKRPKQEKIGFSFWLLRRECSPDPEEHSDPCFFCAPVERNARRTMPSRPLDTRSSGKQFGTSFSQAAPSDLPSSTATLSRVRST